MSVSKEDLRRQNRELAEIVKSQDQEISRLVDQETAEIERVAEKIKTDLRRESNTLRTERKKLKNRIEEAQTQIEKTASIAAMVVVGAGWIAMTVAGAVLWAERGGIHPRWITITGGAIGFLHLTLVLLMGLVRLQ